MMVEKKRKYLYWLFKLGGVLISCFFPIWAICEKYPLWTVSYGTGRSVGVGAILILIVVTIIFRRSVFKFISERLKLEHAPPLAVWLVLIAVSYILIFIGNFLRDLTTVLWMGMLGCAIGTALTFVGENFFGEKENKDDGCGT
jgi:hypothetical protein